MRAKPVIHRYAMLGILNEHGNAVKQMGELGIPKRKNEAAGAKILPGKACKEFGNAMLINKDGCEFRTNCGDIGACG
jgi:ribonucleoside-diphosphate reductase alpha chain